MIFLVTVQYVSIFDVVKISYKIQLFERTYDEIFIFLPEGARQSK